MDQRNEYWYASDSSIEILRDNKLTSTDRPFTDLHNTEGTGGFPGPNFFARPVVGGHFAFLALGRACEGKAMKGLAFLDDDSITADGLRNAYKASMMTPSHRVDVLEFGGEL